MNYIAATKRDMAIQRKLLRAYTKALEQMPPGRLAVKHIRNRIYFYVIDEKTRTHSCIPKKNHQLILKLKQKRWMKRAIKIMEQNLNWQEKMLHHYQEYDTHALQKLLPLPDGDEILADYEKQVFPDLEKWSKAQYRKNAYKTEELKLTTSFGLKVRSKSELMIAELLYAAGIPFHYDAAIEIYDLNYNKVYRYVDFLIKTPEGEEIIWEHFGMFGIKEYRDNAMRRFIEFFQNGIFQPDNLIITMDGPNGQLDMRAIERIIEGQLKPLFC